MNPIIAILTAGAVSATTTAVLIAAIVLLVGHVQNDRSGCMAAHPGAVCALTWEPVQ